MPKSKVCVDANLVIALVTVEAFSSKVLALWREWTLADVQLAAPGLLRCEVASALHRKVIQGILDLEDARQALKKAMALDIQYRDSSDLSLQAFELAARFQRPAAYDAHYLALSEHLAAPSGLPTSVCTMAFAPNFRSFTGWENISRREGGLIAANPDFTGSFFSGVGLAGYGIYRRRTTNNVLRVRSK